MTLIHGAVLVEGNPDFNLALVKDNRITCGHCGRSILTFKRPEDSAPRFYWHKGNQVLEEYTAVRVTGWRKCPGSGKEIR